MSFAAFITFFGLGMTMVPFLGAGFAPDPGAAWTGLIAGPLAMIMGAIGWVTGRPPTVTGISQWGNRYAKREPLETWFSGGGFAAGLGAVLLAIILGGESPAAVVVTAGLGVFLMIASVWEWAPTDPTRDYFMPASGTSPRRGRPGFWVRSPRCWVSSVTCAATPAS